MILFGIFMYIYIYAIPIAPIYTLHILTILSIIYLIFNNNQIIKCIKDKACYIFIGCIFIAYIYISLVHGFQKSTLLYVKVLENIPIVMAMYVYIVKRDIKLEKIINVLIINAMIQSSFAIMSFFIKPIQNLFVNMLILTRKW